jgi:acetylornithine/succinyldiaminopimelate/putrescine aminotransferase
VKSESTDLYRRCGPLSPDAPEPVFAVKAEGAWLEDGKEKRYLDLANGGSLPLGYNHPDIAEVLKQAGHRPGAEGVVQDTQVELCRVLAELVPGGMNRRVLVCDSGREGLARAIELARSVTHRSHVSYLSDTSGERPAISKDVAAVVAHPLDGRVQQVGQACDAAGALLIDDETGIGPGACGTMFASELSGVKPDIFVLGRGWAAGLPFGACVTASSRLRWTQDAGTGPAGCAAALAVVGLLKSGLLEAGRRLSAVLDREFEKLSSRRLSPALCGVGLARTIVFAGISDAAPGFVAACRRRGLLLRALSGETVAVRPPLVAAPDDLKFAAGVLRDVMAEFDK